MAATAQELGLFERLARGPARPSSLAAELGLSPRGTRALLGALEALGLARRDAEGRVALTGQGRARFVDRDAPDFEGPALALWHAHIRRWATGLAPAVRAGGPPGSPSEAAPPGGPSDDASAAGEGPAADEEGWAGRREDPESLSRFLAAMDNKDPALVLGTVERALARLEPPPGSPVRVLDLGGGPGTFARVFAERGARVVLFDRPEVIEHAAEAFGLAALERLELRGGDFLDAFPEGPFDLVLLANITHIYDPETNRRLLADAFRALAPGGAVAILDFVRGMDPFAALFAITMLLNTERGDTYGRARYEEWLSAAGFGGVRVERMDADRHLITARRPAGHETP